VDNAARQTRAVGNRRDWNLPYFAFYGQDKIQVNSKLLLDIGLRWETAETFRDNEEGDSAINLGLPNPAAGGLLGAYMYGDSRVIPAVDLREFGPRLGVAYRINDKTVARVGFATNYSAGNGSGLGLRQIGISFIAAYNPSQTLATLNNGITPTSSLDNGFPAPPYPIPAFDPGLEVGGEADYYNPGGAKQPQASTRTFDVQREFPHNILVDAAYVANHSVHISADLENLGQVPATWLSLGSDLDQDISCLQGGAGGLAQMPMLRVSECPIKVSRAQ